MVEGIVPTMVCLGSDEGSRVQVSKASEARGVRGISGSVMAVWRVTRPRRPGLFIGYVAGCVCEGQVLFLNLERE